MIEFRVLGPLNLRGPEGVSLSSVLAQPKRVALLAYLAVATPRGFHRRDKLLGLFWPERDQEHGRSALRNALYFLRQSLGEGVIVSRGGSRPGGGCDVVRCRGVRGSARGRGPGEIGRAVSGRSLGGLLHSGSFGVRELASGGAPALGRALR